MPSFVLKVNIYEGASGQKINIEKSKISFSTGVNFVQKGELTDFLYMRLVDMPSKYLGVPTTVGVAQKSWYF